MTAHNLISTTSPKFILEGLPRELVVPFRGLTKSLEQFRTAVAKAINSNVNFVSVLYYEADVYGLTDSGGAFQRTIDAVYNAGGGIALVPPGTYLIQTPFSLKAGVTLQGVGAASVLVVGVSDEIISSVGSINTGQANTLASNVAFGSITVTLSAGKGANFVAGNFALIMDAGTLPHGGKGLNERGEIVRIRSVATDTLTLEGPLVDNYTTANSAEVQKITTLDDVGLKDLKITNPDTVNFTQLMTEWGFCYRPKIENVVFDSNKNSAIMFQGCIGHEVTDCYANDLESGSGAFGYLVVEAGPNIGLQMTNCVGERVRHVYTSAAGKSVAGITVNNGYPIGSIIGNSHALYPRAAGFDTHEDGLGIVFNDCSVLGGIRGGFQMRCVDPQLNNCVVYSCTGPGFSFEACVRAMASSCKAYRTNTGIDPETGVDWTTRGAFYDAGKQTELTDCKAIESGHDGFQFANHAAVLSPIYKDCTARDIGKVSAGMGFNVSSVQATVIIMQGCMAVSPSGTGMTNGFDMTSAIPTAYLNDCHSEGHTGVAVSGSFSVLDQI